VEALAERGLITQAKSRVPLKVVWRARAISRWSPYQRRSECNIGDPISGPL